MRSHLKFAVIALFALPLLSHAAELAILRNGNSIRHERREVVGAVTRLYLSDSASGYIEIPSDQIERFEADNSPAPVIPALTKSPATQGSMSHMQAAATPAQVTLDAASLDLLVSG